MLISICLCTYQRDHLLDTLLSLTELNVPLNTSLEVIVVDNDALLYGKPIIEKVMDSYPYHLIYTHEPQKNIAAARNKCLNTAQGEWIAFIDDDEVVDVDWLMHLYRAAQTYNADAVFGQVVSTYPDNTPHWIIEGKFFDRKVRATGTEVSSGACNCTLVSTQAINDQRFDLAYGLSGGEDADFFHRLHKKGKKLVYCHEAFVSEEVEPKRLCIEFLISRKIRIGSSFSKYRYEDRSALQKTPYIVKNTMILCGELLVTLVSYPLGKVCFYKWLLRSADRYGKLKYFYQNKLEVLY